MDIGSFLILLGIFLLSGLFVVRPFFDWKSSGEDQVRHRFSHLIAEKERLLSAIQELDLDLELHKISPEDHKQKRARLTGQAAEVLQSLDQLKEREPDVNLEVEPSRDDLDELEALISSRRRELEGTPAAFCPHCGGQVESEDKYCTHCGEEIK